jgi:predicted O-methyltransferase YrrM
MPRILKSDKELYSENLYAPEDDILKRIRDSADPNIRNIQINPIEGKTIQILLRLSGAESVLEIGSLVGYSAIWIARALPENGKLICIEKSEHNHKIAQKNISNSPESKKITLINDDAKNVLMKMKENFDAIFIDADKTSYPYYLEKSYGILNQGGLIIADNTFCFGSVYNKKGIKIKDKMKQAMMEFNKIISDPMLFCSVIIPTGEGLTVAIKK